MTEIQRNSTEWFVLKAQQTQKDAIKNLQKSYENCDLDHGTFEEDFFLGTKDDIHERYEELQNDETIRGFLQNSLIERAGGVDNVIEILDANNDGEITQEEIDDIASLNIDSETYKIEDEKFTAKDLRVLYQKASVAEGAEVEITENKTSYKLKNGDSVEIEYGEDGHIKTRTEEYESFEGERFGYKNDYDNQTDSSFLKDSQGRIYYENINAPGVLNDKKTVTEYDDINNTKTVKTSTIGKTETIKYNDLGEIEESNLEVNYNSDGEIGNTKQSNIGDCWLLSGVNALAATEKGREIIKNSIQQNDDGSVTVTLKGVNRSYTYSAEEVALHQYKNGNQTLSTNDIDMNLIEMAVADYKLETIPEHKTLLQKFPLARGAYATKEDPLNSGNVDEMMEYLTGEKPKMAILGAFTGFHTTKKAKDPERYAMTAAFLFNDPSFDGGKIITNHVYSVSRVTSDTIYLVNPWDSSQEIAYPKSRFYTHVGVTALLDLNKVD